MPCPECHTPTKYTEDVLRDVLARGLADNEIQLDLLGHKDQEMSFEEVMKFVEAKEAGKRSAHRLVETCAARSLYKHGKQETLRHTKTQFATKECTYCGQAGHGKNAPPHKRRNACPAYGKLCTSCSRSNHFASVCRGKAIAPRRHANEVNAACPETGSENASFDSLCALMLDHHLYDDLSD
eukprot:gene2921-3373_t